ncbi:MAG: amidotransferase 1, exosortase A system-associated [Alphaproteobacteria bacterium]|nr:amidotransferase 1, exosortase A system-associated [Alphaproteobacteria bacterium]
MCGIAGWFDRAGERAPDRSLVRRMTERIAHRGPDGEGFLFEPGIGLGHRRLAIIDVAGGDQPIWNEDRSVGIVFNGEIYNFRELTRELEGLGHRFNTRSDTEAIVHAWEQWDEDCVKRLRGMFAFAIWDRNRRTLFLARDRLGKKPLYYAEMADRQFLFASELKSLLVHPGLDRSIDRQAVEDYFALGYVPDPKCIFSAVRKLGPGESLRIERGGEMRPRAYWRPRLAPRSAMGEEQAASELIARLKDCVDVRLISEVPLGAFLSGGVDSSGVVAMMASMSDDPVRTFNVSFGEAAFDESQFANLVAQRYRTAHVSRVLAPEAFDILDRLPDIYDEPFGDASALPTFRVCAMARTGVTVALSGDAGDELFAGYRRYLWHLRESQARKLVPGAIRRPLFGTLGRIYPKLDWAPQFLRARTTFQELALDDTEGYFNNVAVVKDGQRQQLYSRALKSGLGGYHAINLIERLMAEADTDDVVAAAQYTDLRSYLVGDILTKVDRASMANGLEVRVPMLDHTFVEWAAGLPRALKIHGSERKFILKKALEPFLPHEVLYRPKQGFSVPLASWFRGPLRARLCEAVASPWLADSGLFDQKAIGELLSRHLSGRSDHSQPLWLIYAFEGFLRRVVAGEAAGEDLAAASY